jgi:hypothetical protein
MWEAWGTRHQVSAYLHYGVEAPIAVSEVLGTGPLRTRLQVSARRGLTRFVGRQSELEQLRNAFEHAKAGHGQIVGVMGEPEFSS